MILNSTDEIMGALERGELSKDLSTEFQKVLAALVENDGGNGSITLKLKIQAKGEMVSIKAKLDSTTPQRERRTSTFFVTGDGRLSLQHPAQVDMFAGRRREAEDVDHD